MAELVDALVSNTSGATRAGSIPALGTLESLIVKLSGFFYFPPQKNTLESKYRPPLSH